MTIRQQISAFVTEVAKEEDGFSEAKRADIDQVVGIISDRVHADPAVGELLKAYGAYRAEKRPEREKKSAEFFESKKGQQDNDPQV